MGLTLFANNIKTDDAFVLTLVVDMIVGGISIIVTLFYSAQLNKKFSLHISLLIENKFTFTDLIRRKKLYFE